MCVGWDVAFAPVRRCRRRGRLAPWECHLRGYVEPKPPSRSWSAQKRSRPGELARPPMYARASGRGLGERGSGVLRFYQRRHQMPSLEGAVADLAPGR